jgi:hypothetical protein
MDLFNDCYFGSENMKENNGKNEPTLPNKVNGFMYWIICDKLSNS